MLTQLSHNDRLLANVQPPQWENPTPPDRYNLVAIGAGAAGLVSSLITAGLGGRVAIVERHLLGGDCLNYGCVPSKALIRAARVANLARTADQYGVEVRDVEVNFPAVMERMRRLRADISRIDAAQRLADEGVDVWLGEAHFTAPDAVEVDGRPLKFARCVIAAGASPRQLDVPGLEEAGYLTNESLFSLTDLPRRFLIVGGGPIGVEMAQAFQRFGSRVQIVDSSPRIMSRDTEEAVEIVQRRLQQEGVELHLGYQVRRVTSGDSGKRVTIGSPGDTRIVETDEILVAAGRTPNVSGLNLEAADVKYSQRGVEVDDRLRTSNRRIYAAGDIAGHYQFTHAADAMARMCVRNAFFFGRQKLSGLIVPHATYTDPELAQVGITPEQAEQDGVALDVYRHELADNDRAILEGETEGYAAVYCKQGSGKILGGTVVGPHAGDLIAVITLMMERKIAVGQLGSVVHCYPTLSETLKKLGDQYTRTRLTPLAARVLKFLLRWRR